VAVGLAAWSVIVSQQGITKANGTLAQLKSETAQRINETCTISETKQKSDVDRLAQTYKYLGGLSKTEMAESLNRAVLASLPSVIREAQLDDAPGYCDAKGVGLPEPDPKLPVPPTNIPKPHSPPHKTTPRP
jgi:hypothetical protein